MNNRQLIERLRAEAGLSRLQAAAAVKSFFNQMADALSAGDRVEIRGLWSFQPRKYRAYIGRNPKNGNKVRVPGKKMPFFKCGKELRERLKPG